MSSFNYNHSHAIIFLYGHHQKHYTYLISNINWVERTHW